MDISVKDGSVTFIVDTPVTFENLATLVKAGQLAGVPANAVVVNLHMGATFGNADQSTDYQYNLTWTIS